jgi:hypothetical protein
MAASANNAPGVIFTSEKLGLGYSFASPLRSPTTILAPTVNLSSLAGGRRRKIHP